MKTKDTQPTQLEKIIALMPGTVYWKDREGCYQGCNDNTAALVHLKSPQEIIGKTLYDLFDKEIADRINQVDEEIMSTGKELTLEEYAVDQAGNPALYITRKIPLHDETGKITGLVGISIDITERKKMEHELSASKEKTREEEIFSLKKILELMPGNVYWKDRQSRYLGCNKNVANLLQLKSSKEIAGKTLSEFCDQDVADETDRIDEEIMSTDKEADIEEDGVDSEGNPALYLTRKVPLHDNSDNVIGLVGISLDITDRKRMEEELRLAKEKAEEASHAKTQFLAIASHELRLPLTGILGMANFLEEGDLGPEETKEYTKQILSSGKHLLSVINDILDFAKLEADKFEIASSPLNLKTLIEDVINMLTITARSKGIELWLNFDKTIPHRIYGDPRALRQIFVNLIGNAIKFTERGHINIKVTCPKQTSTSAQFEFAIEDTGIGIPADKIDLIFDRFQQVQSAYTRSHGGTGLGLAISKKLLELMNGDIHVTSELDKGTTFHCIVEFPLQSSAVTESPWAAYEANVKILVIDDTHRGDVLCKHMNSNYCETVTSDKAMDAMISAQQQNQPYDIILVEKQLQNTDPFDLLRTINRHSNLHKPMSLLLVSSNTLTEKQTGKVGGFFDTIIKSLQPIAFQTALTSAWESWSEQKEKIDDEKRDKGPALKVLLVEDDLIVQTVHKRMLSKLHCDIDIADNGLKAIKMSQEENYDIIFMDVGLPGMSGFDVIKTIRQRNDGASKTPIVALTGYSGDEEREACLAAGANDVAVKPVESDQLKQFLDRYRIS